MSAPAAGAGAPAPSSSGKSAQKVLFAAFAARDSAAHLRLKASSDFTEPSVCSVSVMKDVSPTRIVSIVHTWEGGWG